MSRFQNRNVVRGGRHHDESRLDRRLASYLGLVKGRPEKARSYHKPGSVKKKSKT